MDAFTDPEVEEIVVVKAAQTGGTEAVLNMIGSLVDEDPGPAPCASTFTPKMRR